MRRRRCLGRRHRMPCRSSNVTCPARPPRIALVRQRYTAFGGAERFTHRILGQLAEQGASVSVIARQWQADPRFTWLKTDPPGRGRLQRDRRFHQAVCAQAAHFDLIQSHERIACCDIFRAGDGVHAEWLQQRARLRGAWSGWLSTLSGYHRYTLAQERSMLRSTRLKAVICNSLRVKAEFQRHYAVPDDTLRVIYSGIDPDVFNPTVRSQLRAEQRRVLRLGADQPLVVLVGSGFERKGVARLLKAARAMTTAVHIAVIGQDRRSATYRALARALGMADRVRFTGPLNDVRPWLAAADMFCLPTLYDPFPNSVLEALAMGLPTITSHQSGATDLLRHAEHAFLVDALDIAGLTSALETLCDAAARQRIGAAGHQAVKHLTLTATADAMRSLYETVLTPSP